MKIARIVFAIAVLVLVVAAVTGKLTKSAGTDNHRAVSALHAWGAVLF